MKTQNINKNLSENKNQTQNKNQSHNKNQNQTQHQKQHQTRNQVKNREKKQTQNQVKNQNRNQNKNQNLNRNQNRNCNCEIASKGRPLKILACVAMVLVFILPILNCGIASGSTNEGISDVISSIQTSALEESLSETEAEFGEILQEQLEGLNLSGFDSFLEEQTSEFLFEDGFYLAITKLLAGGYFENSGSFISGVLEVFLSGVSDLLPTFVTMLAITLLVSVLCHFTSDFLHADMQKLTSTVLVLIVACCVVPIGEAVVLEIGDGISKIATQAELTFPILVTLVYALGGTSTASCFSPLLYVFSNVILKITSDWIYPIFIFVLGVNLVNSVSPDLNFSKIADFFISLSKYILGISFTIFFGVVSLQGISAGSFDSISYRTAKYAISNSVPVIGSYVSSGFDLIVLSGMLLKNAVGVGFVLLAFGVVIAPLFKLLAVILLFRLLEGVCSPFASKQVLDLYKNTAKCLSLVATAFVAVFFMYSIAIVMLMISSNMIL